MTHLKKALKQIFWNQGTTNFCPINFGGYLGRGGGQVVSVLAFYSDDPSSNPADDYSFFL